MVRIDPSLDLFRNRSYSGRDPYRAIQKVDENHSLSPRDRVLSKLSLINKYVAPKDKQDEPFRKLLSAVFPESFLSSLQSNTQRYTAAIPHAAPTRQDDDISPSNALN